MKSSKVTPPYSISQEHYLLKSYEYHQNKLLSIYTNRKLTENKNPFFEKQLQSQYQKHFINKPLRNWNYQVTVENNSLLKRMNEIKQKKKALLPDIETKKLSKTGSMTKRTLNIDQRIRNIKQIMKENEFLEKRLQTVSSTIDLKKIQNGFESNLKHSGNISKFSRRTVNGFIGAKPLKTPQTPSKPKTKAQQSQHSSSSSPKIQQLNPTLENNITNDKTETNRKKDDLLNEKIENHQETEEKQTKLTDVGSIAESKTLEELLKKQEISNLDVKQSGLFISERIDNGNIVMTGNLNQSSALQVNIEKSMKIE